MTLEEARERIGQAVVYRAPHIQPSEPGEQGVITSVNEHFVFVRYGASLHSQATPAHTLEAVAS